MITVSDTRDATTDRGGDYLVESVETAGHAVRLRDYPVAQFFALVLVLTVVIGNRLADAGYSLANPRLRHR